MIPAKPLAVLSKRILSPEGFRDGAVLVEEGRIKAVAARSEVPKGWVIDDAGELPVLPGLVDTHVHINEPGRTEWEGFETATRAAAAGGITALLDMPLNSLPVTTTRQALDAKRTAARGQLWVDCGFVGGVIPGHAKHLADLAEDGVFACKAFLIHSGIEEFPNSTEEDLREAMPILAERGLPLMVHAEMDCCATPAPTDPTTYAGYLASRPRAWENSAIDLMIRLSKETGCRVHIVHLSSADALESIARAKEAGAKLTVETCPHYLCLEAESIPDGATHFKCAPPIREAENRERLWQALESGLIDFVVSDHSPCTPELKKSESGDFHAAWGGIASLQFTLPAMWSEARGRGHTLDEIVRWMSRSTAQFAGLPKGALAPGLDADIVVFDPEGEVRVTPETIHYRNKICPYTGRRLTGAVHRTYLAGRKIYDNGSYPPRPTGRALTRGQ